MDLRSIALIVAVMPTAMAFAPPDPAPVIVTIPCTATWLPKVKNPNSKEGVVPLRNRTTITLGPVSTRIPAGAEIHLAVFAQNINPLPQPQPSSDIYDYKAPQAIEKGKTGGYPFDILVSWDACSAIAKFTPIVPDLTKGGLRTPQPTPSGPLSGTGEGGSGTASPGPDRNPK